MVCAILYKCEEYISCLAVSGGTWLILQKILLVWIVYCQIVSFFLLLWNLGWIEDINRNSVLSLYQSHIVYNWSEFVYRIYLNNSFDWTSLQWIYSLLLFFNETKNSHAIIFTLLFSIILKCSSTKTDNSIATVWSNDFW